MNSFSSEKNNTVTHIAQKKRCTGCGNCVAICPKQCLAMTQDAAGFSIVVENDNSSCVNCALCLKVCPEISVSSPTKTPLPKCFAAWHRDPAKVRRSSSGGAALALSESFIERNGVVAGVVMQNSQAIYKLADSIEQLTDFCGSKYIPADIYNIIYDVEKLLANGKNVLFFSLPCQAAAIRKRFADKKFTGKLYLVDMVCAGVPSPEYLRREMQSMKSDCTAFRSKEISGEWRKSKFLFAQSQNNSKTAIIPIKKSPFYNAFACSEILRDSCYDCQHAKLSRDSDLTLADFWGEKRFPEQQKAGISMIMLNSLTGKELLADATHLELHPASLLDAVSKNPRIYHGINVHRDYLLRKYFYHAVKHFPLWLLHLFYGGGYQRKIFGKLPYRILWNKRAKHRRVLEEQSKQAFIQIQKQITMLEK